MKHTTDQLAPADQTVAMETPVLPRLRPEPAASSETMRALRRILEQTTGLNLQHMSATTTFVEMGLDSLTLTQVAQTLQKQFGCRISFRQLLETYPNLEDLALRLSTEAAPAVDRHAAEPADTPPAAARTPAPRAAAPRTEAPRTEAAKPFGAAARVARHAGAVLTAAQKDFVDRLIERYNRRTGKSKAYVQAHRDQLADPRTVSGFDPVLKEMVYPIVAARSAGARLWDLDGNEYIDVVSGFGSSLFGYLPPFVKEAMQGQLERGIEIGPQTPLAGEVAQLICELTHLDRAAFCNTGSEAVLAAMRVARTVTGRSRIAMFSGSYHGIFDEVLVRGDRQLRSIPASPGVPPEAVANMLVVDYDTPEALEILEANMDDLAAVLVEPVQSRRPELQPRNFLRRLRRLTERSGTALIMDEMITGFRIDQGGAQAHFGVRGDLATYGKIIGGGMPIGVIAGKARFMDAIDGGFWDYGDNSTPEVDITYFAGTFVRHPLALAAARASLDHLKASGPALQQRLNEKSNGFVAELNGFFSEAAAPLHLVNFGSLLKMEFLGNLPFGNLLYYLMRDKGVHIGEHRPFFFTTAHTDADYHAIGAAFRESVKELQSAGFLVSAQAESAGPAKRQAVAGAPTPDARLGRNPQGEPSWYKPDPERPGKFVRIETREDVARVAADDMASGA